MEKVQPSFHYSCCADTQHMIFNLCQRGPAAWACFLLFREHHSSSLAVSLLQKCQCRRLVCRQWPDSRPYGNVVLSVWEQCTVRLESVHIRHLFSVFSWKDCYKHLWQLDLVKLVPPARQRSCPHTAVETQPPHPTAMAVLHFWLLMSSNVLCLNVFFLPFVLHSNFLLK